MASFNKVILMGNLTRDPELRFTQSNMAVCKVGLAVNRRIKDQQTGPMAARKRPSSTSRSSASVRKPSRNSTPRAPRPSSKESCATTHGTTRKPARSARSSTWSPTIGSSWAAAGVKGAAKVDKAAATLQPVPQPAALAVALAAMVPDPGLVLGAGTATAGGGGGYGAAPQQEQQQQSSGGGNADFLGDDDTPF